MMMIALAPGADAAKRVALVIGNNDYAGLPQDLQLKKAINDAKAMRDTLEHDLGFQVFYGENADWRGMNVLVTQLETSIEAGDVVFFYFAGHGVSVGAENYLLPADVPPLVAGEEARLLGNSFGAEELTRRLQAKAPRAIFAVLDACRNNPFRTEGGRAAGGPSGLQRIDAAKGVFTLYAAGLGQVALDRLADDDPDPNSVFTRTLIPLLKQGGLSQVDLAKQVQSTVAQLAAKIGHVQEPAYYDQILGFVALKEGGVADIEAPKPQLSTCALEWPAVANSQSAEVISAFRDKCAADSLYRGLATERLALLAPGKPPPGDAADAKKDVAARILGSTERAWSGVFQRIDRKYEEPTLVLFSMLANSACGMVQSATGSFYCPKDRKIYLDLSYYEDEDGKPDSRSDLRLAYVIAHEVGHHVQNVVGIAHRVTVARQDVSEPEGDELQIRMELQADCFAGIWAKEAGADARFFEEGDEAALHAVAAAGFDHLEKQSRDLSADRVRWFKQGLQANNIRDCDTFAPDYFQTKPSDEQLALNVPAKPPELAKTGCDGAVLVKVGSEEKCLKPGDVFRDCDACPEMVVMAAGRFLMGEPDSDLAKRRRIEIAAPFAMSRYEVTFAEWDVCASAGSCPVAADNGWGRQNRPAINVSWNDAKQYAGWLSRQTGQTYRLPSETEWEYSTRANSDANYSFGDDSGRINDYAWNGWNSGGLTHPVGEKTANAFGLHDVHGNVSEFVEDCYSEDTSAIPLDGTPYISGDCSNRVARGGSWNDSEFYARSGERQWFSADLRYDRVGFRIARTLGP
jgi:predicted metalloprotease